MRKVDGMSDVSHYPTNGRPRDFGASPRKMAHCTCATVRNEGKTFGRGGSVSQFRCAIYARYSTVKQNPLSIDAQIRKCREFAARNRWEVLDAHIYSDEAISGATCDRFGLKSLLEASTAPAHSFD